MKYIFHEKSLRQDSCKYYFLLCFFLFGGVNSSLWTLISHHVWPGFHCQWSYQSGARYRILPRFPRFFSHVAVSKSLHKFCFLIDSVYWIVLIYVKSHSFHITQKNQQESTNWLLCINYDFYSLFLTYINNT